MDVNRAVTASLAKAGQKAALVTLQQLLVDLEAVPMWGEINPTPIHLTQKQWKEFGDSCKAQRCNAWAYFGPPRGNRP